MNLNLIFEGVKHPVKAFRFMKRKTLDYWKFRDFEELELFDKSIEFEISSKRDEIDEEFSNLDGEIRGISISAGTVSIDSADMLYKIIETEEPKEVVETGVCNGLSTYAILKALKGNSKGELTSIDLPERLTKNDQGFWSGKGAEVIPPSKEPGWIIPDSLQQRWTFIEGDSNFRLPEVLESKSIDIFIHDSEHSYQTMMLEFCLAWKKLKEGGLIISDDWDDNQAFVDFARSQDCTKIRAGDYAILRKEGERN